jgi:hypothetical protein
MPDTKINLILVQLKPDSIDHKTIVLPQLIFYCTWQHHRVNTVVEYKI